jgi:cytochrome c553
MARTTLTILCVLLTPGFALAGNSHCFFYKAAPVVYAAPLVYHTASPGLVQEAQIRRAVREELQLALQAPQQAKVASQPVQAGVFAKCAKCHSAGSGRTVLDGSQPVSCATYFRWGQIAGQGKNIPAEMDAIIKAMSPQEKGAVNDALLNLVATSDGELR